MSSNQAPQQQAKDIQSNNPYQFMRYSTHIIHSDSPLWLKASYAVKLNTICNSQCILVLYKIYNKFKIGYAKKIYLNHPLVQRQQDLEKKIQLQDVISLYFHKDKQLCIKYNLIEKYVIKEVKQMVFEFKDKKLLELWINLYIEMKDNIGKELSQKELQECRSKRQSLDKQKQDWHLVNSELNNKCMIFTSKIQQLEQKLNKIQKVVGNQQEEKVQMQQRIRQLQCQIKTLKTKIDEFQSYQQTKEQECRQYQSKLKERETIQSNFEDKYKQLRRSIDVLKLELQQERSKNLKIQQESKTLLLKLKEKMQINQKKVQELSKQNQSLNELLKQRFQEQTRIKQNSSEIVIQLKSKISKQARDIDEFSQKSKEKDTKIDRLQLQLKQRSTQLSRKQQQNAFLRLQSLFVGHVLQDYHHHKLFLKDTLEFHRRMRIIRTRLLFRYDPHNKVNFHLYIDNHPDLLLVIKTTDGAFLAGYTESPISAKNSADRSGMIISLTNQLVFQLVEDRKSVTYDDYYIIFGNSEIRLKSLELSVFSNFGISNGFYESKGRGVEALLCHNSREVDIQTYQVHRVYFGE